jgi:leucyl aminopeptidase
MKIKIVKSSALDTRISFIVKESSPTIPDFKADKGEIAVRYEGAQTLLYCGLGEGKKISPATLRSVAAAAIQKAAALKRGEVCLQEPALTEPIEGSAAACLEGVLLGSYSFTKYKSEKPQQVVKCEFVTTGLSPRQAESIVAVCDCVDYARDLVNDNAGTITPQRLAHEAKALADDKLLSCTILTEKEIDKQDLGLLKAVGQGSRPSSAKASPSTRAGRTSKASATSKPCAATWLAPRPCWAS